MYEPLSDNLFKSIAMTPKENLKIGDKVRYEVFTDEHVSSAKLIFLGVKNFLLISRKMVFVKEVMLVLTGTNSLNLELTANLTKKKL